MSETFLFDKQLSFSFLIKEKFMVKRENKMHLNCQLVAARFSFLLLISHREVSNPDSYYQCKHGAKLCL